MREGARLAITEVIQYEGDNSTFVWKHPAEDFNTNSQLIVHETQEAVFFLNGQPLDRFGSGRYTLETQNIPLLRRVVNIPTGGQSAFHCEVYFIKQIAALQSAVDELNAGITALEQQKKGLGLFKGKEKAAIQEQIDALKAKAGAAEAKRSSETESLTASIAEKEARIKEIETTLENPPVDK